MAARLDALREELDSVRNQAAIDPVTEIFNRASFDEQIEREVDLATLFGKRGCLVMVDIDDFKWVNDTHGILAATKCSNNSLQHSLGVSCAGTTSWRAMVEKNS